MNVENSHQQVVAQDLRQGDVRITEVCCEEITSVTIDNDSQQVRLSYKVGEQMFNGTLPLNWQVTIQQRATVR